MKRPVSREYSVRICDPCYLLAGEECATPGCVFYGRTMAEVGEYLDMLLIRPVVCGRRLDLYPARRNMRRLHTAAVAPTYRDGRTDSEDPE